MEYLITEKENLASCRRGQKFEGTLTQAKRHAIRNQCFFRTVLTIEDAGGIVAVKDDGGSWKAA